MSELDALTQQLADTAAELTVTPAIDIEGAMAVDTSRITPLAVSRKLATPKAQNGTIRPFFWLGAFPGCQVYKSLFDSGKR